jgi:hypothetical protein
MIINNLLNNKLSKMKKIFLTLSLVSMIAAVILPALVSAANTEPLSGCTVTNAARLGNNCNAGPCVFDTGNCALCCTLNTVYTVTDWVFFILMAVAVFMIILAGFKFVTGGDKPEETAKARQMILYAAVGIAVALLARAVPSLVKFVLGGS